MGPAVLAEIETGMRLQRARGHAAISFVGAGPATRLGRLRQEGAAKLRLPRVYGAPLTAVVLNTAGGLTGGDEFRVDAQWGAGAVATLTAQAAERLYRSLPNGPPARVETRLTVLDGATAAYLPQETILFDGARLSRQLDADVAEGSRLILAEAVVLGRTAMGEQVRRLDFRDRWRLRRAGRLVFADDTRITGDALAVMAGPATGAGANAFATAVVVDDRASGLLDAAREALTGQGAEAGVSVRGPVLVARLIAPDGRGLRTALAALVRVVYGPPPLVWSL